MVHRGARLRTLETVFTTGFALLFCRLRDDHARYFAQPLYMPRPQIAAIARSGLAERRVS